MGLLAGKMSALASNAIADEIESGPNRVAFNTTLPAETKLRTEEVQERGDSDEQSVFKLNTALDFAETKYLLDAKINFVHSFGH